MKKVFGLLAFSVLCIAAGCNKAADAKASASKEKITLRLDYPEGFEQEVTYKMHTDAGKGQGSVDELITIALTISRQPDKASPLFVFSGKVEKMEWSSDVFGQAEYYNSAQSENTGVDAETAATFDAYKDRPFTFEADAKGTIKKGFTFNGAQTRFDQLIDLNNYFIAFPEQPVTEGDTWDASYRNEMTSMDIKRTYTLKSVTADKFTVGVVSVIPAFKGLTEENTYKGDYIFDRKTGMLISGELKGTLNSAGGMGAEMAITLTGKKK